jgi:ankyrin repeat protein
LLEQYVHDLLRRYRDILTFQDDKYKRNPIHYAAMAKGTNSLKTLEAILDIDIDKVNGYDLFYDVFTQLWAFELPEERFDPRRCNNVLAEFRQLMRPDEFNGICRDFKIKVRKLLQEVLNQQDKNYQSPLHISSYFGAFKHSHLLQKKGAEPTSAAFAERPLNVSKDKFTRNVLQNLNKAAQQANSKDIQYLVNCGSKIDDRKSITGEAPIHKVVLSAEDKKPDTLKTILDDCQANVNNIDSNGWSALHHACYIGDLESAKTLIEFGANKQAYSNQNRTPLHFAAMNNHVEIV